MHLKSRSLLSFLFLGQFPRDFGDFLSDRQTVREEIAIQSRSLREQQSFPDVLGGRMMETFEKR